MSMPAATEKFVPAPGKVLVLRIREEQTEGGLILTRETEDENTFIRARVIAVGPDGFDEDGRRVAVEVLPGDLVLLPKFGPAALGRMRLSTDPGYEHAFFSEFNHAEDHLVVGADKIAAVLES
jgi:co-chaperonin GroES (HSP10)